MHAALALLLALAPLAQAPAPAAEPRAPDAPAVLARPAVLGASLSAGFGLQGEAGRQIGFADVLEELLLVETAEPLDGASPWFFLDPEKLAGEKVPELAAREPTVLFAVDFLFWFAYGAKESEERHLARFEHGLALLDRFPCPIIVGDLPDMSRALEAPVKMIAAAQVPEKQVLARLNARLRAWAAERPRVCVVPLADFTERMVKGERLELRGNVWEEAAERTLQADWLHPSLEGEVAVGLLTLDVFDRAREDVTPEMVRWSAEAALAALRPAGR